MKARFEPTPAHGIPPEETAPSRFWGPALALASLASWALVFGAAKLAAAFL